MWGFRRGCLGADDVGYLPGNRRFPSMRTPAHARTRARVLMDQGHRALDNVHQYLQNWKLSVTRLRTTVPLQGAGTLAWVACGSDLVRPCIER